MGTLSIGDLGADPIPTVRAWLAEAETHIGADFNSMVLATVDGQGRPSTRNVLLREVDSTDRFWFFTNRSSHKGRDIASNSAVSLLFSWLPIHRQIRVDGVAEELDDVLSDEYFYSRPRDSQVAAWASEQSSVLASRSELLDEVRRRTAEFEGREVRGPRIGVATR
ncbi:MAG: pyridoxal 5'-phosphate synthase [Microthrixaceae bacterium]|nr:pyridoxal 5'-phosphate synthase [Microthrixaceae bacterium]